MQKRLEVGQIVNTFGIKGEVKVMPFTDDITRFDDLEKVYVKTKKEEKISPAEFIASAIIASLWLITPIINLMISKKILPIIPKILTLLVLSYLFILSYP